MKNLIIVSAGLLIASSIVSCGGGNPDSVKDAKDSNTAKIDSQKSAETTPSTPAVMPSKDDAAFVVMAAAGGMDEVELGKLAGNNASHQRVKDFGAMMVRDHGAGGEKLKAIATAKNVTLPAMISNDQQKAKDDLAKKQGKDFDKAYVSMMIDDHKKDISEFEKEAKNGTDPEIKAFASDALPMLHGHLDSIEAINKALKK